MAADRNDRDVYEPGFGTRLRYVFVTMGILVLIVLIAAGLGVFD